MKGRGTNPGSHAAAALRGGALALWPTSAVAEDSGAATRSHSFRPKHLLGFSLLELRGGLAGHAGGGGPAICAEIGIYRYVAIEACGSGAGFLYPGENNEMVHFRAEGTIPLLQRGRTEFFLQPGFGFAEVERGSDAPGFLFGPARSSNQREAAGPEFTLGLKLRLWPHERFFFSAELTSGAAWIDAANVVLGAPSPVVPFVGVSGGLGF